MPPGIARKDPVPRLSILIPALGDCFELTLASVLQHQPDDSEVLVVHSQPYDDPYHLSGDVCFVPMLHATQTVELLNTGFEAARSGIVHVVQSGLEVTTGWTDEVEELFDDEQVATVAPVIVDAETGDRVWSAGLGYSRFGSSYPNAAGRAISGRHPLPENIIGPTQAAGFYRRSWWRLVRWNETLGDDFADTHFNLTLAALGATTRLARHCILSSVEPQGLAVDRPFGFSTARLAERLFWSHRRHAASWSAIGLRTAYMLAESVLALPSHRSITGLLGRIAGLLDRTSAAAFQSHVAELSTRLAEEHALAESSTTLSFDAARKHRSPSAATKKRAA